MIYKEEPSKRNLNFIEAIVEQDLKEGKNGGRIQTRFPPEPNGYLHIGHAKAICLDFGIAEKYGGICNLRFDDTNPLKEDVEYVDSIMEDIQWLGFQWKNVYYASDYFQKLWDLAVFFIKKELAYVDEQSAEIIAKQKGTPTIPGIESPYRNRPVEENLELFYKMSSGEIPEGAMVLRAKIDMSSPNMHMRDPIMYRIITSHPHHRTGWKWKVYPMYDFAHGQCDYFEGVTHSLCTLEFEVHRPLYDWFIDQYQDSDYRPRQIEFNRLNLTYTILSKRKLLQLVQEGLVNGWDDPRMPTLCGLRRRGYTPEAIRNFINKIGYTKFDALNDIGLLEYSARENLNKIATRVSAVLYPVKLIITNYPDNEIEILQTPNNPEDPSAGTREIIFSKELYIEQDDFMENAPKNYFRLTPGQEVRLKSAYIVKCTGCKKNEKGEIVEVYCEYDPNTKSGMPESNRKVKGTIHWVSVAHSLSAEVRLYDRLFRVENPSEEEGDFRELLNPDSLKILTGCKVETFLQYAKPLDHFQFQRIGYFTVDMDATPENLIFNRTVSLKDSWAKEQKKK
ncbi:MAG TPA: glutamine--tRNA ligase/YqeY domain fusion protein [Paludibacteraceae bacterium]|nr:glutamine--tRNA ligase/YqeY domain fusion protein [Paludibacteraceae bacterium]HPO66927.1 glutamine--tRNA ligase/YqeY domain fusion protein [Paludibacteraceae bacterium]